MKRLALLALLCVALTGCSTVGNVRDYATMLLYQAEHKVLLTQMTECGLVMDFVRERDMMNYEAVCDAQCNCKLVKRQRPRPVESGICR